MNAAAIVRTAAARYAVAGVPARDANEETALLRIHIFQVVIRPVIRVYSALPLALRRTGTGKDLMIKRWRKQWFRRKRIFKRSLRDTHIFSIFGKHAFHPKLWRSDRRSVAGGLAVGLFTAFTPTIPFQMLVAAVGAILFKVNMPLALAACWVTNPLTAVPIYMTSRHLGKAMLTHHGRIANYVDLFVPAGQAGRILREGLYLTSGSLVFASLAAGGGYLLVIALWKLAEHAEGIKGLFRKRPCQADREKNTTSVGPDGVDSGG